MRRPSCEARSVRDGCSRIIIALVLLWVESEIRPLAAGRFQLIAKAQEAGFSDCACSSVRQLGTVTCSLFLNVFADV